MNAEEIKSIPKKRGRKPKIIAEDADADESIVKIPKKRGRKPKGGKIIETSKILENVKAPEPNVILHLKCRMADLNQNTTNYNIETFQFEQSKTENISYHYIKTNNQNNHRTHNDTKHYDTKHYDDDDDDDENDSMSNIWKKLKELTLNLHTNNIADKKSACFWCTCDFDNPPIYIPKYELNNSYHCYGCFCSPECATAFLFKEQLDTSMRFERYHLINHLYCKIYNYEKNVKPAPNPYYTLNKYYGNLSIQEYRRLLKNERLLLVIDKPLTRTLPELHEDNDEFILNNKSIPSATKFKLKRTQQKQSKSEILSEAFNVK
jgi:hypothetical protein